MTEKELRKLNRYQLLELLIMQTERADELQKKLEDAEAQMHEQEMRFSRLGSIAEASLELAGVFETAQKAADLYLENARRQAEEIVEAARKQVQGIKKPSGSQSEESMEIVPPYAEKSMETVTKQESMGTAGKLKKRRKKLEKLSKSRMGNSKPADRRAEEVTKRQKQSLVEETGDQM